MIRSFVFSEGKLAAENLDLDALKLVRFDKGLIIWVDLDQPTEEETKAVLEKLFQFHPLSIEDCVTVSSLPKLEDYDDYSFLVMHAVDFNKREKFNTNELNLFIGKEFLVTYHQQELRPVRATMERCAVKSGAPIARGPDRLAHTLLDLLTDSYKPVVSELSRELDDLEDLLLDDSAAQERKLSSREVMGEMLSFRKDLSALRQIVRPQREVVYRLSRGENKFIRPILMPYYRDLHDDLNKIEQAASSFNERLLSSLDVYINKTAYQTNEGIKMLTALTAITLPPLIVGGWYGMNFSNIPELHRPWMYWVVLAATVMAMLGMWLWIRKKNWF
ncbi:MAG: magnesium/cobalt transporter CorA [Verrucomicrobiales bacterium]|jgi:magnesium transporter|nr:magnesium/cobalt transporter CorA [Verrucomicrobiales bacterium]